MFRYCYKKTSLVNVFARRHYKKQEILFKFWIVLGLEQNRMCKELLYYGLDSDYFNQEESLKHKYKIKIGQKEFPSNLPESGKYSDSLPNMYKENNWELFRIIRRSGYSNLQTPYLCKDDIEALQVEMSGKELNLNALLNESAFFGSIKCFKWLIVNGAVPNNDTMKMASYSGNEEILQTLLENGIGLTKECLSNSIENWNNAISKWMIEEKNIKTTIHSACFSNNISFFMYLINKGFDINAKGNAWLIKCLILIKFAKEIFLKEFLKHLNKVVHYILHA